MTIEMTAKQLHELCESSGIKMTLRMAYYIQTGKSRMSYNKAKILSAKTGVSVQAWIDPQENLNPYLPHLFGKEVANG